MAGILATAGLLAVQDGVLRLSPAGTVEAIAGGVLLVFGVRRLLPAGARPSRAACPRAS